MSYTACVPCLLGLEGLCADELRRLGMEEVQAENGRVYFKGDWRSLIRADLCLATGERVLIELGRFTALSFEELFEGARALPWEDFIPYGGAFPVKGHSLDSKLFSVSDCQRIIKKAIARRLGSAYRRDWLDESGPLYQVVFSIMKDRVSLCIDTTGPGLHKRGYRPAHNAAPLRETIAAGLVRIARYRGREDFCDPFCGSGTIAIEAALAAKDRAPGLERSFAAMDWPQIPASLWRQERERARAKEYSGRYSILARDIDPQALELAKANARRAGVQDLIRFELADARSFDLATQRGIIVTNPPYGQRMLEQEQAAALYRDFGRAWAAADNWQLYLLSAHPQLESCIGRPADKKRKLYNGSIRCDLFMYLGKGEGKR